MKATLYDAETFLVYAWRFHRRAIIAYLLVAGLLGGLFGVGVYQLFPKKSDMIIIQCNADRTYCSYIPTWSTVRN